MLLGGGFDIAEEVPACYAHRSTCVDHGFQDHWSVFGLDNPKPAEVNTNSAAKNETRTCYICNKPGHIAPNCPDKAANKQKAQRKLFKNKNFMVLWQESRDDQDEQTCTTRVVEAWGDDSLCPICHKHFTFDRRCDPEDKRINKKFDTVKSKLRRSPLLAEAPSSK